LLLFCKKEESSFSEEKEAKRLLLMLSSLSRIKFGVRDFVGGARGVVGAVFAAGG
jgi:hypothetical protein